MTELNNIITTEENIRPFVCKTPLLLHHSGSGGVLLKCENKQITGSYKVRGAVAALLAKKDQLQPAGVTTMSSGNFAAGLAQAAKSLGVRSTVIMPRTSSLYKQNKAREAADSFLLVDEWEQGIALSIEIAEENGMLHVHPYDDMDVIRGQGSVALEIAREISELDALYCPVGGGGLLSGCAIVLKSFFPKARIVAVEPEVASDFAVSFKARDKISIAPGKSIADGLLAPSVGDVNWPILRDLVDEVVTVSEDEIKGALGTLYRAQGIVAEPSGAVAFAGWQRSSRHGELSSCIISGGNIAAPYI